MKKVAATRGQSVRRTNFFVPILLREDPFCEDPFRLGAAGGWRLSGCRLGVLAVANFYGFLLKRLTLTTASPSVFFDESDEDALLAAPGIERFPGHFGEVSSQV
jgi:hypothetical protein